MLRTKLIQPQIMNALAAAGHGSTVLIADGNYPASTRSNPDADLVYLNLMPGMVKVTDVLEAMLPVIPVESIFVMQPTPAGVPTPPDQEPSIWADFRKLIPSVPLQPLERFEFYDKAKEPDIALVVSTGDQRLYANIILTIGVVPPESTK